MPLARYSLAAAAAACLLGGLAVAYADTPPAPPGDAAPSGVQQPGSDMQQPDQNAPPAPTASTGQASDTAADAPGGGVQVIASRPVPDTPANRAKYGQPMSRAGKHTAPTGD